MCVEILRVLYIWINCKLSLGFTLKSVVACQVLNSICTHDSRVSVFSNIQWESGQTDFPIMDSCGDMLLKAASLFFSSAADCSLTFMSAVSIRTHYSHSALLWAVRGRMRVYHRCWHMVRVQKVFVYILMCDGRLLLNTLSSCFEI